MHIQVLPNGQDDIEGIRVVRHPETLIGKGIGYLCLASHEAVLRALTLNNCKFKKMKLRVTTCGKRTKRTEQQRLQRTQSDGTGVSGGEVVGGVGGGGGGGGDWSRRLLRPLPPLRHRVRPVGEVGGALRGGARSGRPLPPRAPLPAD